MPTAAPHGEDPAAGARGSGSTGSGLITFAGVLLILLGSLNALDGIAAIARSHFFVGNAHYVFGDLRSWGWAILFLAVAQLAAAYGVLALRAQWARWTGVVVLGLNAFAQMVFAPSYPLWSVTVIAIDVIGIYGLTAQSTSEQWAPTADGTAPPVRAERGSGPGTGA
ncbi:hypothetical protein F7Q99_01815 [Streptomyces kaniharaensis]|uniref:DUF7144 domain-containing protein n=1 Tax=Streptomyces kaniharaensis TaxID=212423 RepID=A0A6N7KHU3_9ACTN|nr:hypothetical protein [Streptomyces kaniharaensis]MQS11050.1 hypothetical protein [Streptomyces kaniharaensis]